MTTLELGIIGLLSTSNPTVLGYKEPSKVGILADFQLEKAVFRYYSELSNIGTEKYQTSAGYKPIENLEIGYEIRFDLQNEKRSGSDFIYIKYTYKFKNP